MLACCRWHDDLNTFKSGVRDLEAMLVNVINVAYDSTGALPAKVGPATAAPLPS